MARAGILYSQVAATATRLFEKGENPTVDKVRQALGNTGSKSTIAPLLKRWKTEHAGQVPESQSGLPVELINAVKHIYEQAQQEAAQKIEIIQEEMDDLQAQCDEERAEAQQLAGAQKQQIDTLASTLSAKEEAHEALIAAHNAAKIDIARLEADASGLQLRLGDRQEEIKGLQQQLQQARTQYEHYQQAMIAQRDEEQRRFEHAKVLLEKELSDARKQIAATEHAIATQQQQIGGLTIRIEELGVTEASFKQLQETHAKLAQHLNTQTALAVDLSNRHEVTSEALLEAQKELAILRNEHPALKNTITGLESEVVANNKEIQELRIDKARLEQQLLLAADQ